MIGVSGGPDSMCCARLMVEHFLVSGRDLHDIHIAHYHHHYRLESDLECEFVQESWADCVVHVGHYQ